MTDQTPPPPGQPDQPGWGGPAPTTDAKGFFRALFDFSFESFVTPRIVKIVYVLATVAIGLLLLVMVVAGLAQGSVAGILMALLAPVVAVLYLAVIRMTLEFYFAIVRMSEDIHRQRIHG